MVSGGVAFGGTFNGNCLSLAAARVSLQELSRDDGAQLKKANQLGEQLMQGISALGRTKGIPLQVTGFGTAFSVHFTERTAPKDYRDTLSDDRNLLRQWLSESLEEGIYLLSDGRVYTSIADTSANVEATLTGFGRVLDRWSTKRGASVQGAKPYLCRGCTFRKRRRARGEGDRGVEHRKPVKAYFLPAGKAGGSCQGFLLSYNNGQDWY